MTVHIDPITNILHLPHRHTPTERDRLDVAATKLAGELQAAGATMGSFYITYGLDELHLYAPRAVMLLAQANGLACDFVVDWHELKSNIADTPTRHSLRSEPASALSPVSDAGSTLSEVSA
jgi:hypothetical protein